MEHLTTPEGRRIAYVRSPGAGPEIAFLPGFQSDMEGTKALHLEAWAKTHGRAFLRFDYSGHGSSSGAFQDGCVGDWAADAAAVIFLTAGQKILVGSSMGGWIALLLARDHADRVAGLVGIAAAPDFTSQLPPWTALTAREREELDRTGKITTASEYDAAPTIMTRRLYEDGARQTILQAPLSLPMPVRLLHGTEDRDVPLAVALALVDHARSDDLMLTVLKGADHRFSTPGALALIEAAVAGI